MEEAQPVRGQLAPGEGHFPERLQRKTGWSRPRVAPAPLFFDFPEAAPQAREAESQHPHHHHLGWEPRTNPSERCRGGVPGREAGHVLGWLLMGRREGRQGACLSGALPHLPLSPTPFLSDPRDASAELLSWPRQASYHLAKRLGDGGLPNGAPTPCPRPRQQLPLSWRPAARARPLSGTSPLPVAP